LKLWPFARFGHLPKPAQTAWRRAWPQGRAGAAAALACAGGVLALLLTAAAAPRWRAEARDLRAEGAVQRAELLRAADRQRAAGQAQAPAWPPMAAESARVRALIGLAQRHGVRVRALRQQRGAEAAAPGGRDEAAASARWLRVAMTAEGSYPALRRFVEAALADDAALALDSLVLQRADAGVAHLRAELAWALGSAQR
jgi:hypothetical protein